METQERKTWDSLQAKIAKQGRERSIKEEEKTEEKRRDMAMESALETMRLLAVAVGVLGMAGLQNSILHLSSFLIFVMLLLDSLPSPLKRACLAFCPWRPRQHVHVDIPEFTPDATHVYVANELYQHVQHYLSHSPSLVTVPAQGPARLTAFQAKASTDVDLYPGADHVVEDTSFQGHRFRWKHTHNFTPTQQQQQQQLRVFTLEVPSGVGVGVGVDVDVKAYLSHIWGAGEGQRRRRSVYTIQYMGGGWARVPGEFRHPATLERVGMRSALREAMACDLQRFRESGDWYKHVGRPWKRGWLLSGPPGSGKTTLVAAVANSMGGPLYDLDLSRVEGAHHLRELLLQTCSGCVIVVEDIDRFFESSAEAPALMGGLLGFADGLLSCFAERQLLIFTACNESALDSALKRPGRMDVHWRLGYCCYEAFLTLAQTYLQCVPEMHPDVFNQIKKLFPAAKLTSAQVCEMLIAHKDDPLKALGAVKSALSFHSVNL